MFWVAIPNKSTIALEYPQAEFRETHREAF